MQRVFDVALWLVWPSLFPEYVVFTHLRMLRRLLVMLPWSIVPVGSSYGCLKEGCFIAEKGCESGCRYPGIVYLLGLC